ncbi:cytochrome c oxidase-assembly factor cox23 [Aspergillus rambellii]|uniref:Cytochrome c oxidase-assembly factor cox23 n=2 Tax=Aspergillus subgen. Nidulantes TaxID=2720870 RepID=A0A0F8VCA8_9EURO|nr:cytochrome c oxidase-assembly factor cox23 [Aspergillus rambellii]KKK22545.1 cytochrome c oxidase-assembly factor cox23 [Aspergillus ochraceoroseus]
MASQPDQPSSSTSSSELVPSNAWERVEKKFNHKSASEYYDPCQDYADRSLKCMKRNGFDREMCHDYFQYVPIDCSTLSWTTSLQRPELQLAWPNASPGLLLPWRRVLKFLASGLTLLTKNPRAYRDCKKQWVSNFLLS